MSTRSCTLNPSSTYAAWPPPLLETLCRSYIANGTTDFGVVINSLSEAFGSGEPSDFNDALSKAHVGFMKTVYDRVILHAGLWPFVNLLYYSWKTDNEGFVFSIKDSATVFSMKSWLDSSPRFARDVSYMQYFHQDRKTLGEKLFAPTHTCWREVVNGTSGLHICISGMGIYNSGMHVDPHQIVVAKKADGTCEYDIVAVMMHGWDIKKLFVP